MKNCLYCSEEIDIDNDDFQKIGKKYVCVFCYDDYCDELDNNFDRNEYLENLENE